MEHPFSRGKVSITQASDQGNRKMPSCPQKRGLIQVSSRRRKIGKTQAGKGAQVMPRRNDTRSGHGIGGNWHVSFFGRGKFQTGSSLYPYCFGIISLQCLFVSGIDTSRRKTPADGWRHRDCLRECRAPCLDALASKARDTR